MSEHELAQDVATESIVSKFLSQRGTPASDPTPAPNSARNGNRQLNREVKIGLGVLAMLLGVLAAVVTLRATGRLPEFFSSKKAKLPAPLAAKHSGDPTAPPAADTHPSETPEQAAARRFAIQAYGSSESAVDDGGARTSAVAPASAAVPLDADPQASGPSHWDSPAPEQIPSEPADAYPVAPGEAYPPDEANTPYDAAPDDGAPNGAPNDSATSSPPRDPFAPSNDDPFASSAPRALPDQPAEPLPNAAYDTGDSPEYAQEDQANPFAAESAVQPTAAAEPATEDPTAYANGDDQSAENDPAAAIHVTTAEPNQDPQGEPPLRYDLQEQPAEPAAADDRYPAEAYDPRVHPAEAVDRQAPHVAAAPRRGERAARRSPRAVAQEPVTDESVAPEVQAAQGRYTIEPQDNYWRISQKLYGTGRYFKALYEHNKPRFPRSDQLRAGDEILAPPAAELERLYPDLCPPPAERSGAPAGAPGQYRQARTSEAVTRPRAAAGQREYTVAQGDTLFDIARYELGKASRWIDIYELNRDQLGENVNLLRPGMTLLLPEDGAAPVTVQQPGPRRR